MKIRILLFLTFLAVAVFSLVDPRLGRELMQRKRDDMVRDKRAGAVRNS